MVARNPVRDGVGREASEDRRPRSPGTPPAGGKVTRTRQRSRARETTVSDTAERTRQVVDLDRVIIRFAGDSGDGMQLTGDRFTSVSAMFGNDLATLPEFPAEIRAPAGTLAGVSAFQIHISDHEITTPGDAPERARGDEPGRAAQRAAPTRSPAARSSSTRTRSRSATWRRPGTRPIRSKTAASRATRSTTSR